MRPHIVKDQINWDAAEFRARIGDRRPIAKFLRSMPSVESIIDHGRLADVIDPPKRKRGPIQKSDPYAAAIAGKPEELLSMLQEIGLKGDVPDLLFIAGLLAPKKRGRPRIPRLRKAVRDSMLHAAVIKRRQIESMTLEDAFLAVKQDFGVSVPTVRDAYYSQSKEPSQLTTFNTTIEIESDHIDVGDSVTHQEHGIGQVKSIKREYAVVDFGHSIHTINLSKY